MKKRLFALLFLVIVLHAHAQERVDLAMMGRIRNEGFNNSQVMDIAWQLTDMHGPRLTGSPYLRGAQEWARDKFKEWGLVNAQLEPWGTFGRGWMVEKFSLELVEPKYAPLYGYPKAWTGSTNGEVVGTPVYVKATTEADLEKYQVKLKGAIVLSRVPEEPKLNEVADLDRYDEKELTDLAMAPEPGARSEFASRREEFARMRALADKAEKFYKEEGVAVLLEPSREHDYGTFDVQSSGSRNVGAPIAIPVVAMSVEHYARLVRMVEKGIPIKVAVNVKNKFFEQDSLGYNVVAEIAGTDKKLKDELVMLGGHLDSWHGGTGATDNAAGCSVVMEAMRILKALNVQPRRTIRAALWSGEEQGLLGSRGYVEKHFGDRRSMALKPEHERFSAYFNMDNGTGKFRGIYLQEHYALRPIFEEWFKPFHDLGASTLTIRNTGGTDHQAFNALGLPGFQFIQDAVEYRSRTHHSNFDVYDQLSKSDLMQAAVIMAAFVYNAAMREEKLPRKELPKPEPSTQTTMRF